MKTIAFYNYYNVLNKNNNMFENAGCKTIKDFLAQMHELKRYAGSKNIRVGTVDVIDLKDADAYFFIDMPNKSNKYLKYVLNENKPIYLLEWESKIVKPENRKKENYSLFNKVFTYDDDLIDNKKYFKVPYTFIFPNEIPKEYDNKKLCTLIAGNKYSSHPLELYSKRIKLIRWLEKNYPDEFDLYGKGWNAYIPGGSIFTRIANKVKIFNKIFSTKFLSYKGEVDEKKSVFQKYKFAVCYENVRDIPGYITEKIFDCFFSGCIPIYWGANNITDFIPGNCFIDKRNFTEFQCLYDYIKNITKAEYFNYINNIEKFLNSEQANIFRTEYFAKTIIDNIYFND